MKVSKNKVTGIISNIERCAFNDGFGLRTLVFLKGCPLRCKWCSNPEGQKLHKELMYFENLCTGCGKCVEACPEGIIELTAENKVKFKQSCSHVYNCGKCVDVCPAKALRIVGEEYTVQELLDEILKDSVFYHVSKGGVTLSGGEPLAQPKFSESLLKACKQYGIHTAIETSGYVKWRTMRQVLRYCDLLLMDFKHTDPQRHREGTGVDNRLILENALKASKMGTPMIARIPVIPGYDDSMKDFLKLLDFIKQLETVIRVDLLPYHRLGVPKYKSLIRDYPLKYLSPPTKSHIENLKKAAESYGFKTLVGG